MKLDMVERPVFEDANNEKRQNMKSEMSGEVSEDAEKKCDAPSQWNIPVDGDLNGEDNIEVLMSRMSLMTSRPSARLEALVRLVGGALSRADRRQLRELAATAENKSRPDFVRHLGRLLDKDAERAKGDVCRASGRSDEDERSSSQVRRDTPVRRDLIAGLKDEDDLCPRSPMRPQHHRPSNFPYQNASRNHHSGGIMSAVAYSDAIGPTPQYNNHMYQSLGTPSSRAPLVVESSDVLPALETSFDDLESVVNLSEGDLQILMSLAVDLCPKTSTDYEMFPESISEINSKQFNGNDSKGVDRRVPSDVSANNIIEELFPSSFSSTGGVASVDTWGSVGGGYYHDDSTSGCSSLSSPHSFSPGANPSSPDSYRVVPDNVAPHMSPPGQFFDDRLPEYPTKPGDRSPGSSGYSSTGAPSPGDHTNEDFDTRVHFASNDYFCNLDTDFDSDYLLPEFENVFESTSAGVVDVPTASINLPCHVAEFENPSDNAGKVPTTYATLPVTPLVFAPGYSVAGANNLDPHLGSELRMPPVSNLKRLEPKVEHLLRVESGRERILKLMDKKKKAEAWVKISLKINEAAKQDQDGDTQLMILCANADHRVSGGFNNAPSYVLEYVYAMVEALKGIPGALSKVNNQGHSAVYLAALHGDYLHRAIVVRYIAETLVDLGEELTHTTDGSDSILHELCKQGDQRYDILVELLSLKNQAGQPYFDVNQYNSNGFTPLHVAVSCHGANKVTSLMTVQLLLAERADVSLTDKTEGHTALHMALLESCAPRLVEALLRGSSQATVRTCNALNLRRDSPLHCAASRNDVPVPQQTKVIQLLLRHGAVKSLNACGKFPIALVAEERRQEIRRVYETRKGNQANAGVM